MPASALDMPPPKQKPVTPTFPLPSARAFSQRAGEQILGPLRRIELGEQLAALVVVARVAAHGRETVRGEGIEVRQGKTPRDVFRVRIEAAILVDDENARQFRRRLAA